MAVRNHALHFELALRDAFGELLLHDREAIDLGRADFFFLLDSRPLTLDTREIGVSLSDLVPDGRRFAEQTENHRARRFDGLLGLTHAILNGIARLVLLEQAGANLLHFLLEFRDALRQRAYVLFRCARCGLRDRSIPDRRASCAARYPPPRVPALRAALWCVRLRDSSPPRLVARIGQLRFESVKDLLRFLARGIVIRGLNGQILEFRRRGFERRCRLLGLGFERNVASGENGAEL